MNRANLITFVAILLAFIGIIYHRFLLLGVSIICINSVLDFFDGYIAKKYHMETSLGKKLDFINDTLSFLLLTSVLIYNHYQTSYNAMLYSVLAIYIFFGLYRLVRFTVEEKGIYFKGLPTTAAGVIIGVTLLFFYSVDIILIILILCLSILMVSKIPVKRLY